MLEIPYIDIDSVTQLYIFINSLHKDKNNSPIYKIRYRFPKAEYFGIKFNEDLLRITKDKTKEITGCHIIKGEDFAFFNFH